MNAPRTAWAVLAMALVAVACGEAPTAVPPPRDGLVEATIGLRTVSVEGAAAWGRHCQICHGATGAGDGFNAKLLPERPPSAAELDARYPDDTLANAIARGSAASGRGPACPAWRRVLGPGGISAVAAHVRALVHRPTPPSALAPAPPSP